MNYRALGKNIRKYRQEKGLNQEELAELVGCTSSHIGQIENARGIPSLEMTVRIANALGVSADVLLQDVVDHANESILSELSAAIGRMPKSEQTRILNAIRALTE